MSLLHHRLAMYNNIKLLTDTLKGNELHLPYSKTNVQILNWYITDRQLKPETKNIMCHHYHHKSLAHHQLNKTNQSTVSISISSLQPVTHSLSQA